MPREGPFVAFSFSLAMGIAVERDAERVTAVARPLREGLPGALWRTSKACAVAGLALDLLPRPPRRIEVAADGRPLKFPLPVLR
ncbi:hypothetical protein BHS06_18105 [Myxococcus xanthus]|uniref:hypothetical protein n=1 Tax=Myxococcus xanthus TaxID=34 RepID=UPI0011638A0D|nr:hypothetical protein [Myxococcus xanthus]QDE90721.1 hypothetical protein BHS06_18105 [Myxococcus xanthus]